MITFYVINFSPYVHLPVTYKCTLLGLVVGRFGLISSPPVKWFSVAVCCRLEMSPLNAFSKKGNEINKASFDVHHFTFS